MAIQTLYVTGDGTITTGWRAEGGDYTRIDDNPTNDGDTTTLYTPTQNSVASWAMGDTSGLSGVTINSLIVHAVIKRIDPPANSIALGFYIGGSEYLGSDIDTSTNGVYEDLATTFTTNPATSLTWTVSDIDGMETLIKKTGALNAYRLTQMYAEVDYTDASGTLFQPKIIMY